MTEIEGWLKTTMLGIIILGTIGSVVALLLLKVLGWLARQLSFCLFKLIPSVASRIASLTLKWHMFIKYRYGYECGYQTVGDVKGFVSYCAFQLSFAMLWYVVSLFAGISTLLLVVGRESLPLTIGTYLLLVTTIVSFAKGSLRVYRLRLLYDNIHAVLKIIREKKKHPVTGKGER